VNFSLAQAAAAEPATFAVKRRVSVGREMLAFLEEGSYLSGTAATTL
jgi:hypothetical protein